MPRIFVGNFDFEHELADDRFAPPQHVRRIAADLVTAWIAVGEKDDVIWSPEGHPSFNFSDYETLAGWQPQFVKDEAKLPRGSDWTLVPWGWTKKVWNWGQKFDWSCPAPPMEVVRRVNSRAYRWDLERRLQIALPGSAVFDTLKSLLEHISQFGSQSPNTGWGIKANYGMSGRERQLGRGPHVPDSVVNWVRRRLAQSGAVVFEPWLNRVAEAGIQIDVPATGSPTLLGILPLLTDAVGTYRGSQIQGCSDEVEKWAPAVDIALKVAGEVQHEGYFGPLGIDVMQSVDANGRLQIRLLQDLNARYTMGRLGLGLRRFLPPDCAAAWVHHLDFLATCWPECDSSETLQLTPGTWLMTTQDICPR